MNNFFAKLSSGSFVENTHEARSNTVALKVFNFEMSWRITQKKSNICAIAVNEKIARS